MWIKIITILTAAGALITGIWFLDDRNETKFARAEDLKSTKILLADSLKKINTSINKTNIRIEQNSIREQTVYTKREMQEIVNQCKTTNAYSMPQHARDRYNGLKLHLESLNIQMKRLNSSMGKQ
jgi:hypothetical protein